MDINSLRSFIAVVKQGSFSAAAQQLHLTQPAVSKRIAALERELGVALLDRLGRGVVVTEAGRLLTPRAERILAEIADSRRAIENLSGSVAGQLAIATSHHIGLHRLPPLLREFAIRYPQVQLDIRFVDSEQGCEAVLRGESELAIVTLPPETRAPLRCTEIWSDPLAVMVPVTHPLANLNTGAQIEPVELTRYPVILPGEVTFTRRLIDRFFAAHRLTVKTTFSTNYLETIKMMVSVGLGWSVLPRSMADDSVATIAIRGFEVTRQLGLVEHSGHTLSNAAHRLVALLPKEQPVQ